MFAQSWTHKIKSWVLHIFFKVPTLKYDKYDIEYYLSVLFLTYSMSVYFMVL